MARRTPATEPEVRAFLAGRPELAETALWVRSVLLAAEPDLEERIYSGWQGVGYHHPEEGYVCAIFPRDGAVFLYFEHGAALPDPEGVLRGGGSQVRHLEVDAPGDALAATIGRVLERAVAHRLLR